MKASRTSTSSMVFTALFAAIICAGSIISIPIGPVPIVLQNAFAVMAGLLLGPLQGAESVALFLVVGLLGLPVFSGGRSGYVVTEGPTGGYLAGYLLAAILAGWILKYAAPSTKKQTLIAIICATVAGFACIYIPGIFVLKLKLDLTFKDALLKGLVPFLLGDLIKIIALVPITLKLRPIIARYLHPDA